MTVDPVLRLYPRPWQARYGDEVTALLAEAPPDWRDRVDLVRGALDAHLHPICAPLWPVAAAAIAGIAWTLAGALALGQPAPPDWPGYLDETLAVLAGATPLAALAVIGASTRLGDRNPLAARLGRSLVAVAGVAWTILLVLAAARLGGDASLAVAATALAFGVLLIGVPLLAVGDLAVGAILLAMALCLVVPATGAHAAFGVVLVALAWAMLVDPRPARVPPVVPG